MSEVVEDKELFRLSNGRYIMSEELSDKMFYIKQLKKWIDLIRKQKQSLNMTKKVFCYLLSLHQPKMCKKLSAESGFPQDQVAVMIFIVLVAKSLL